MIVFSILFLISLFMTTLAQDMMVYDEGNVYSCPADHLNKELGKLNDVDQGKHFQIDSISHKKFEDMFYDPLACRPFYKDKDAPIWFGRVDGIGKIN